LNVRVATHGRIPIHGGTLLVANHVSWLDPVLIFLCCPSAFVAKAETGRWPLVGKIVTGVDTLLLSRQSVRSIRSTREKVTQRLQNGTTITVFPEATTSDGTLVLPFKAAFFQSAIDALAPVIPVAITYGRTLDERSPYAFVGDATLVDSLVRMARSPGIDVRLSFLPPLSPTEIHDRTVLCAQTRDAIVSEMQRKRHSFETVS
jgi:1-acyl-sn-glycerol-3-phosphate acyltransferase